MTDHHRVEWIDGGRNATQPADPGFPKGRAVMLPAAQGALCCVVDIPYPAPRCGMWAITCSVCSAKVLMTAAGRADDPCLLSVPCKGETTNV